MAGIELTLEDEPVRAAKNVQPLAVGQAGEGHVQLLGQGHGYGGWSGNRQDDRNARPSGFLNEFVAGARGESQQAGFSQSLGQKELSDHLPSA